MAACMRWRVSNDEDDADVSAQQTWSSPSPLLGAKEFDPRENVKPTGFFTASFGFTGAANAAAGISLLPLPRLPFLPNEGAGNRCSHGQFGSTLEENFRRSVKIITTFGSRELDSDRNRPGAAVTVWINYNESLNNNLPSEQWRVDSEIVPAVQ